MSESMGVRPDLVRAARHQLDLHERVGRVAAEHAEDRLGRLAPARIDGRAVLVPHVDAQRMLRDLLIPARHALQDGMIELARLVLLELLAQVAMRSRAPREDYHAAGALIQAVDDPHSLP